MDDPVDDPHEAADAIVDSPADKVFIAPSVDRAAILSGASYSYFSAIPPLIAQDPTTPVVLGVDEAGRGPVLGPMVYGIYYLPLPQHRPLLADTYRFDDSKVLTATFRSQLMAQACDPTTALFAAGGWATRVLSARDIAADQLGAVAAHNLNAQALDATVELIRGVFDRGVDVREIYVDTVGPPDAYRRRLERVFPTAAITVAKKADSLYPCVSAASVCAKVTRDAALEVAYEAYRGEGEEGEPRWGSGYPGDARCSAWLRRNMDPLFGWGAECRFSWATAKDMLDTRGGVKVRWPAADDDDEGNMKLTDFSMHSQGMDAEGGELGNWYGSRVTEKVF